VEGDHSIRWSDECKRVHAYETPMELGYIHRPLMKSFTVRCRAESADMRCTVLVSGQVSVLSIEFTSVHVYFLTMAGAC